MSAPRPPAHTTYNFKPRLSSLTASCSLLTSNRSHVIHHRSTAPAPQIHVRSGHSAERTAAALSYWPPPSLSHRSPPSSRREKRSPDAAPRVHDSISHHRTRDIPFSPPAACLEQRKSNACAGAVDVIFNALSARCKATYYEFVQRCMDPPQMRGPCTCDNPTCHLPAVHTASATPGNVPRTFHSRRIILVHAPSFCEVLSTTHPASAHMSAIGCDDVIVPDTTTCPVCTLHHLHDRHAISDHLALAMTFISLELHTMIHT
ncbi:hypothetical protein ACN47E_003554 [Coniothyrium glycines]